MSSKKNKQQDDLAPRAEIFKPEELPTDMELHARKYGGRTEEDVLFQEPITITLGGKPYEVKPLAWRKNRRWRSRQIDLTFRSIKAVADREGIDPSDADALLASTILISEALPDEMFELLRDYCGDQVPEEVWESATESEVVQAGKRVTELANLPLE